MNVLPKTYLIGSTSVDLNNLIEYLTDTNQLEFLESWKQAKEEGLSDTECLISFYAKLCYKSLVLGQNKNVTKIRDIADNIQSIINTGHGSVLEHVYLNFVITNCSRIFTHELVRHRVGTSFCLTGDTNIRFVNTSGKLKDIKLQDLYTRWSTGRSHQKSITESKYTQKRISNMKLRVYDETNNQFVFGNIKNIIDTGIQPVYQITLNNGTQIKCTKNHKILTSNGWKTINSGLKTTDFVATNGMTYAGTGQYRSRDYLLTCKNKKMSIQDIANECHVSYSTIRKWLKQHKLQYDHLLNLFSSNHIPWNKGKKGYKIKLSKNGKQKLINNGKRKIGPKNPNKLRANFIKIDKIEFIGYEKTYDIEVNDPHHNFIANNIIVHNSQTSGRYVSIDKLDLVVDPILSPVATEINELQLDLEQRLQQLRKKLIDDTNIIDFTTKKKITSAIRRLAPNGQSNEIGFGCNIRAVRHLIQLRTSRHAEWEIRLIFNQIANIVQQKWPLLLYGGKVEIIDDMNEWTNLSI